MTEQMFMTHVLLFFIGATPWFFWYRADLPMRYKVLTWGFIAICWVPIFSRVWFFAV